MTEPTIAERVARGAELLDRREPGWAGRIVAEDLVMKSCHQCVLGQLFSRYTRGLNELENDMEWDNEFECPRDHVYGFSSSYTVSKPFDVEAEDREYVALADAWRAAIAERVAVAEEVAL